MKQAFSRLKNLYKNIPSTQGCIENINKEGGCKGWCCDLQCPQLFYCEFLYIWQEIIDKWDVKEISNLIKLSILNYIAGFTTKGCVLFNNQNKLCKIHNVRPYNCHIYGITPEEEFKPRYEKAKQTYKGIIGAVVRDQCHLISICNGKKITVVDINNHWDQLINIEELIGINKKYINDDIGGSYRTFHDHLLLYMMPDNIMEELQKFRFSKDEKTKRIAVEQFINFFNKKL